MELDAELLVDQEEGEEVREQVKQVDVGESTNAEENLEEKPVQELPYTGLDLKNVGADAPAVEEDVAQDDGSSAVKKVKPQIPRLCTENL